MNKGELRRSKVFDQFVQTANPLIVAAWNSCMTASGFHISPRYSDKTVAFNFKWNDPGGLQRTVRIKSIHVIPTDGLVDCSFPLPSLTDNPQGIGEGPDDLIVTSASQPLACARAVSDQELTITISSDVRPFEENIYFVPGINKPDYYVTLLEELSTCREVHQSRGPAKTGTIVWSRTYSTIEGRSDALSSDRSLYVCEFDLGGKKFTSVSINTGAYSFTNGVAGGTGGAFGFAVFPQDVEPSSDYNSYSRRGFEGAVCTEVRKRYQNDPIVVGGDYFNLDCSFPSPQESIKIAVVVGGSWSNQIETAQFSDVRFVVDARHVLPED